MISEITLVLILVVNCLVLFWAVLEIQKSKEIQKGIIDVLLANLNEGSKVKIDIETLKAIINAK